jgi:hypothetical protein
MEKPLKCICISIFWVCFLINPAFAQNGTPSKDIDKDWEFEIAAYGFAFGITGDIGFRQVNSEVDVDFSDILENLDFGFMGLAQARKGHWSYIIDGAHLKVSADKSFSRRNLLTGSVDVEIEQTAITGYVGYRFYEGKGNSVLIKPTWDFLVGARYNNLSAELGAQASLLRLSLSTERKNRWIG